MSHFMCRACELGNSSRAVSGEGDINCGIFVIGEAPGGDEERLGRPFIGKSGELLEIILRRSGLSRAQVYITNIVKCQPQNNRDPKLNEINTCMQRGLHKEIERGKPRVLVCVGRIAIKSMTSLSSVSEAREKKIMKMIESDYVVIPTYHPSYYLRNGTKPDMVQMGIDDFTRARKALGIFKKHGRI